MMFRNNWKEIMNGMGKDSKKDLMEETWNRIVQHKTSLLEKQEL